MGTTVGNDVESGLPHLDTLQRDSEAFQDDIIGQRLPRWLRQAPVEQLPDSIAAPPALV